jgi:hypothetical protein
MKDWMTQSQCHWETTGSPGLSAMLPTSWWSHMVVINDMGKDKCPGDQFGKLGIEPSYWMHTNKATVTYTDLQSLSPQKVLNHHPCGMKAKPGIR